MRFAFVFLGLVQAFWGEAGSDVGDGDLHPCFEFMVFYELFSVFLLFGFVDRLRIFVCAVVNYLLDGSPYLLFVIKIVRSRVR